MIHEELKKMEDRNWKWKKASLFIRTEFSMLQFSMLNSVLITILIDISFEIPGNSFSKHRTRKNWALFFH
jgi:hypothetical protein